MQTRAASLCLAIALAMLGHASQGHTYPASVDEMRSVRDDTINRDIVAESHLYCLTLAVYFEGGSTGESEEGQRHIARVVVARARANRSIWGGADICDVVFYKRGKTCQFSFACLPLAKRTARRGAAWEYSMAIARDEIEGRSTVEAQFIRYYMNAGLSAAKNACRFRKEFMPVVQAGRHEFFREATRSERRELEKGEYAECKKHAEQIRKQLAKAKVKTTKKAATEAKKQPGKKVKVARR